MFIREWLNYLFRKIHFSWSVYFIDIYLMGFIYLFMICRVTVVLSGLK